MLKIQKHREIKLENLLPTLERVIANPKARDRTGTTILEKITTVEIEIIIIQRADLLREIIILLAIVHQGPRLLRIEAIVQEDPEVALLEGQVLLEEDRDEEEEAEDNQHLSILRKARPKPIVPKLL
jgi:hypothetical protein